MSLRPIKPPGFFREVFGFLGEMGRAIAVVGCALLLVWLAITIIIWAGAEGCSHR